MNQTQEIIKARLSLLSPEYKEFLFGVYPGMTAQTFGEGLGLDEDGILVFENGLSLYLLAFIDEAGFAEFLARECKAEPEVAREIVREICHGLTPTIIYGIHSLYQEMNGGGLTPVTNQSPQSTPTAPAVEKLQSLSQNYNKFIATPPTASAPTPALPSVAAHIADMPIAQPRSSAQLDIMPPPIPDSHFQPVVAAPVQTQAATAQWATPPVPPLPPKDVQPVNTMGTDIERIHGYGAYRDQYPHLYGDEAKNKEAIRSVAQDALLKRAPVVETPDFSGPSNL